MKPHSKGIYGITEAARLAQIQAGSIRRWLGTGRHAAVVNSDVSPVGGRYAVDFLGLVDLLVVGRFRDEGVSLQMVRRVYNAMQRNLNEIHPFAHVSLLTDGKSVFLRVLDELNDESLEEVFTGQRAMPKILKPYLKEIEYDRQIASRWNIAEGVVLDPDVSFGKPAIAEANTTTRVISNAYYANKKDADLVAHLFDISPSEVMQAVAFEADFFDKRAA